MLERRFSRRALLGSSALLASALALPWSARALAGERGRPRPFVPVAPQKTDALVLPRGYTYDLIARWGDAMFAGVPSLTGEDLQRNALVLQGAAERQMRQFGANCDAVAFFAHRAGGSDRGVLCVNNEYVHAALTFGTRPAGGMSAPARREWILANPHAVPLMIAAHGVSIVEVERSGRGWRFEPGAPLTRRITGDTPCEIRGPARGHVLLRTREDPAGARVRGTIANCAGGKTPWGTYLTAEENVDDYFGAADSWAAKTDDAATRETHRRFPLFEHSLYGWDHLVSRFDVRREPREALRFGWIVEIDPRDPHASPRKRTALGRFSHEGANTILARDGRVAVYMGDDDTFEYVYKFVTRRSFEPRDPRANRDLLDEGTLYVARFDADGTGEWLPLVHDEAGPLNRRNGFADQGDVVIKARAAADLLGATPMDRPEDVEPSPLTGHVYVACTKNPERRAESERREWAGREIDLGVNAANPRPANATGHIVELIEHENDAAATRFRWNVLLLAGDARAPGATFLTRYEDVMRLPRAPDDVYYGGFGDPGGVSPIACPDNLAIDPFGRLWVVTDTDDPQRPNNGCFVAPVRGPERGALVQLASGPVGCEVCGCEFTPDGTTLFLSIQHPGEGGSIDAPVSHWPDGGGMPPRSAVVAVRREDGDPV